MLKINEDLFAIDDQIDQLVAALLETPQFRRFQEAKRAFEADNMLQQSLEEFKQLKNSYEEVASFAQYRPEIGQLKRQMLQKKRALDLAPLTQELRNSELDLQELLAEITKALTKAVAKDIFVDTGLPLAPRKRPHGHNPDQHIREKGGE